MDENRELPIAFTGQKSPRSQFLRLKSTGQPAIRVKLPEELVVGGVNSP